MVQRCILAFGALLASCALSLAAPAQGEPSAPYPPLRTSAVAPWWMGQPIIASIGSVRAEIPVNRAEINASFEALKPDVSEATRAAAANVKALGSALAAYGADKARVTTTFSMRPIYDQYRNKQGNLLENSRPDKIEAYAVTAHVQVEVRDMATVERIYATVLAARPTSTQSVEFRLEPDNATNTELFQAAVADANRRAKLAVEAVGARLGAVKLIDPTGRACETDVLVAGASRGENDDIQPQTVTVTAMRAPAPAFAPQPPPPEGQTLRPEDMQLPLQPPRQWLEKKACVIYALGG